jgi:hypothetical protein
MLKVLFRVVQSLACSKVSQDHLITMGIKMGGLLEINWNLIGTLCSDNMKERIRPKLWDDVQEADFFTNVRSSEAVSY